MNLRNSLIALVVLAVLVVVVFIVFREPPAEEMKTSFPDITKDHVTKVWMRGPVPRNPDEEAAPPEFEEVTLEREGEGEEASWRLTNPVSYPAYESYVSTLLTRLEEMELADVAVESRKNWEPLEVDEDHAVHVKVWGGKTELADFWVGAYKTGYTMVRLAEDERVYKVKGSIRYVFGKRTSDWRDKTILDDDGENVTEVTYRTPDASFSFRKEGKEWTQVVGEGAKPIEHFDPARVRSLVASIAKLRAAGFEDSLGPADAGLEPARGEILVRLEIPAEEPEVEDGADVEADQDAGVNPMEPGVTVETRRLLVGNAKDDQNTYLMVEGNPQIFLVTRSLAERLQPGMDKFQSPPREEGAAQPVPPPGPPSDTKNAQIPPEVMKQVQDEIKKQQMMKKLMEKAKAK